MQTAVLSQSEMMPISNKFLDFVTKQGSSEAKVGKELVARASGGSMNEDRGGKWTWTFRF